MFRPLFDWQRDSSRTRVFSVGMREKALEHLFFNRSRVEEL
jgi:hypothetical protein